MGSACIMEVNNRVIRLKYQSSYLIPNDIYCTI